MFYSGDGATMENAAFALGPADGQDFIYKFVGAKIGTMGSGRDKSGNFIDILEAKFEDGKVMNLYFSIQHATNKMFAADEEEEASKVKDKKKKKNKFAELKNLKSATIKKLTYEKIIIACLYDCFFAKL